MTLKEAMTTMDNYYNRMLACTSSSGRKYNGQAMLDLIAEIPELLEYWTVDTSSSRWKNYFKKIKNYEEKDTFARGSANFDDVMQSCMNTIVNTPLTNAHKEKFDDGINFDLPEKSGLYMIGETTFNPFTNEKLFGIKVGKGKNLKERIRSYKTCGSTPFVRDYVLVPENKLNYAENMVQNVLRLKCIALNSHNDEWFFFDEETYFEICEKGFHYFN